jgi:hypothetical protein
MVRCLRGITSTVELGPGWIQMTEIRSTPRYADREDSSQANGESSTKALSVDWRQQLQQTREVEIEGKTARQTKRTATTRWKERN